MPEQKWSSSRLDPKTLERRDAVWLGAPPGDSKAFGDYTGYGEMAISPNAVFVLDQYASRLIRVNKESLEPNVADDLSDFDLVTSLEFVSRGGDVYLGFNETSIVLRFDGTTGARPSNSMRIRARRGKQSSPRPTWNTQ